VELPGLSVTSLRGYCQMSKPRKLKTKYPIPLVELGRYTCTWRPETQDH
jgi:hypothetical protein